LCSFLKVCRIASVDFFLLRVPRKPIELVAIGDQLKQLLVSLLLRAELERLNRSSLRCERVMATAFRWTKYVFIAAS
jgi:hypothetical protein